MLSEQELKDLRRKREETKKEQWAEIEKAAKYLPLFIKVCEQELGEVDHGLEPLNKQVPFSVYDFMPRLIKILEYCQLYVDCNVFYDDDEELPFNEPHNPHLPR